MADNKQIATDVLQAVGGPENVSAVFHCMTRLRFELKDRSAVSDDTVKAVDGVLGVQEKGGQYQIIIGTNVPEVYDELCKQGGFEAKEAVDENLDAPKEKLTWKKVGSNILDYLSGSVVPLIPVLITGALFKTLSAIFGSTLLGIVSDDSDFIFICNMVYNAAFYFLPIMAGYSAAKKLGANAFLGALMGAILIEPSFVQLAADGGSLSVYGIPASVMSYAQTLIPVLLCVWVMSYVEKFFEKHMPQSVRTVFAPFLTFVVMLPVALCALAPLGGYLGTGLAAFFEWLAATPLGWLATVLIAATWPILVLTGMHVGIAAIALAQYAQVGTDNLVLLAATVQAFTASGVGLAVWLRLKDPEQKSLALGYFITQFIGGVGEPLLYGVFLRYKRPWIASIIGGAAAGLYACITGLTLYVPTQGLFSPLSFAGGSQANLINGFIACGIGMLVSFIVAWFVALTPEQIEGKE
ncbi:MAG: PTS transporter subunit EIIC [Tractidigestivibacter sp.]|jgi:PTS system beta-glucosides-specific IIC component|uniref:PTS transporter subunit EIIC n=1 Tax=Tractidigestivibacter sp. TaxID=2847320 RepID=UPI003D8D6CE0